MAGTTTVSNVDKRASIFSTDKFFRVVNVDFVADASDGSIPDTEVELLGYLVKVVSNPGTPAPTDDYDVTLGDPEDSSLDILAGAGADRDTSTTEQAPGSAWSSALTPVPVSGTYTLKFANNSQNSAQGRIQLWLAE